MHQYWLKCNKYTIPIRDINNGETVGVGSVWEVRVLFIQCFCTSNTALKKKNKQTKSINELEQNKTNLLIQGHISSLFQLRIMAHEYMCIFRKENHSTQRKKMRWAPILSLLKSVVCTWALTDTDRPRPTYMLRIFQSLHKCSFS